MSTVRFSFCTVCRNRIEHVRLTLRHNLDCLNSNEELVLLDYNSPDGVRDWVLYNFESELITKRLKLYSERTVPRYWSAHSKNVGHTLAGGEVLVNLDADNFLDDDWLRTLRNQPWHWLGVMHAMGCKAGLFGRLAVRRDVFLAAGGYDQAFIYGHGYDDSDLFYRLQVTDGVPAMRARIAAERIIDHPDAMRYAGYSATMVESKRAHKQISETNIKEGRVVANQGNYFGAADVFDWKNVQVRAGAFVGC